MINNNTDLNIDQSYLIKNIFTIAINNITEFNNRAGIIGNSTFEPIVYMKHIISALKSGQNRILTLADLLINAYLIHQK